MKCSFEKDECMWNSVDQDNFKWIRVTGQVNIINVATWSILQIPPGQNLKLYSHTVSLHVAVVKTHKLFD